MSSFLGIPYPIVKSPLGFFYSQGGSEQIKSDLLVLLLTNPGERVMNLNFGTALRELLFDPNDSELQLKAKNAIIKAMNLWEPRISVQSIDISSSIDESQLNSNDLKQDLENILSIQIVYVDPQNIKEVQALTLELPLSGAA
jgi:hypothetical protein